MSLVRTRWISFVVVFALLFGFEPRPAKADSLQNAAIGAAVAIAVVGAGIGIGIYLLVRKGPSVTGCVGSATSGLQLETDDHQTYLLMGDTSALQTGQQVHLRGKKRKDKGTRTFIVEKAPKFLGSCKVATATP